MKKIGMIALLAIVIVLGCSSCSKYNSIVTMEENVAASWSQVENQYQRRADLIPNLVNIVKGYAAHEASTLEAVTNARAKATSVTIDANSLNEADFQRFESAQTELGKSLGRLLAVAEAYPNLKANENFLSLQAQLEGTENRIAVARNDYNNAAMLYNQTIRHFPDLIIAQLFGFEKKPYFAAQEGANVAPEVHF